MPRTLPWLDGEDGKKRSKKPRAKPDSENAGARVSPPAQPARKDSLLPNLKPLGHRPREPSSSPPPPLPSLSALEPVRLDGNDDCWIMVEDELLSTAQQYTRHLHHEEYKRLKHAAARKNDETLNAIKRPTYGENKQAKRRFDERKDTGSLCEKAQQLAALNEDVVKKETENDDIFGNEPHIFIEDRNLASLMFETREQRDGRKPELSSLAGSRSNTRAAAGYRRADQRVFAAAESQTSPNGQLREPRHGSFATKSLERAHVSTRDSLNADTTSDDDLDAVVRTNQNATPKKVDTVPPTPVSKPNSLVLKLTYSPSRNDGNKQYSARMMPERKEGALTGNSRPIRRDHEQKPPSGREESRQSSKHTNVVRSGGPSSDSMTPSSAYSWRKVKEAKRKKANTGDLEEIPTFLV